MHTLNDGGAMGAAMRAYDWNASPLGPVERWPQALKTATSIMLSSKFPMFLAWGDALSFLYNDGYIDVLQAKHPAALGEPFQQIWAEIWHDIHPLIQRAMAGEATFRENLPLLMHRRGYPEQTYFTFSYSPLRDEDGRVRGMFCACQETTATVLAERRRESEIERLRAWFDRAPGFMAVLRGPSHRFEVANSAYLELVGNRDVVGKTVIEALPEVANQGFVDLLDSVRRSGEPFSGRGTVVNLQRSAHADPVPRVLDFLYQPILGADGSVDGIFVSGYDVTERHLAEARLRESEERFRLIANSAPVPVWVSNLDRSRDFVNQAYVDFIGLPEEQAARLDWRTILHPDDHDRIVAESVAGEASLKPFTLEARYRAGGGEWRWIRSMSQPRWGPKGELTGFIGVAHDVTEAKDAEAALRGLNEELERRVAERTTDLTLALERLRQEVGERERAEEALRQAQKMEAVGRLTGGIAHDFNNLLTPIIGGLDIVSRRIEDPRLQKIVQAALEAGHRGAKLATQLLAFSRVQRLAMAPVPVNRVIEDMGRMLHHTIGPKIEVRHELGGAAAHALCDANQLENAILNLAINARDAMPEGGCLTIRTQLQDEPEGPDLAAGRYVAITVADNGHGMPADVAARAIEPFFSTKPVGKGTGLGLAQVYGIARQSGGTVRIDSREGEGTRVVILLPHVAPGTAEAPVGAPADHYAQAETAGADILIIDDDADVRDFLSEALIELGHRVVACDCAEAGLQRLQDERPDLVLIDFAMPGMNGAQLAREIRARNPDQRLVFVTGYAESEQLDVAMGDQVPVLRKPFSMAELASVVAEHRAA
jgi:PAS domain S-box-containing protein